MSLPAQTFTTITQLISYINTYIVPNGINEIDGTELNNTGNALANFIVRYTLNSSLVTVVTAGGAVVLSTPMTAFAGTAPTAVQWPDNVQNEYYIINALGVSIPLANGFSYTDPFSIAQTSFPAHSVIHIAKASNGSWLQVNNLSGGVPPSSDPQTLLGRYANTAGPLQEITIGTGLSLNPTTGVLSAGAPATANPQKLLGRYANTAGSIQEVTIGAGLALDAGTGVLSISSIPAALAANGVSVDNAGRLVLGEDVDASPSVAGLSSPREIPLNTQQLYLTYSDGGAFVFLENQFIMSDASFLIQMGGQLAGGAKFSVNDNVTDNPQLQIGNSQTDVFFALNPQVVGDVHLFSIYSGGSRGFLIFTQTNNFGVGPWTTTDDGNTYQVAGTQSIRQGAVVGTAADPALLITSTWNGSGSPSLIKGNVVNTSSGISAKLLELQIGGVDVATISRTGSLTLANSGVAFLSATTGGNLTVNNPAFTSFLVFIPSSGNYTTATAVGQLQLAGNYVATSSGASGAVSDIYLSSTYERQLGSLVYNCIWLNPTLLQGGGSNLVMARGIYYNPVFNSTLTAFHRAIEVTDGDVLFNTNSSETTAGKVGIRLSTTPGAFFHIGNGGNSSSPGNAPMKITPCTLLATPETGALENDGTMFYYTPNIAQRFSFVTTAFTQNAIVTVANTAAETTLLGSGVGSLTMTGGSTFWAGGKTFSLRGFGFLSASGSPTLTIKVYWGATEIGNTGAVSIADTTNGFFEVNVLATVGSLSTTSAFKIEGYVRQSGIELPMVNTATVSINDTINNTINVTATWGTSSASNTISLANFIVQINN
jgi:hypothetical protein